MLTWAKVPFVIGWLLLGVVLYVLNKRAKEWEAAKEKEPHISPLNGMSERVPSSLRTWQYFVYAIVAAIPAVDYCIRGKYLFSIPWLGHMVIALYSVWVYGRGREPKFMKGFRDYPNPPSLLNKS